MMAGAIPLASIVITLLILVEAKRRTNSTAMDFIKMGSIWWLIKLSTFRMPPSKHLPSRKIRSFNAFIGCVIFDNGGKITNFIGKRKGEGG